MGTGDGHLKKVVIEGATSGVEYNDIPVATAHAVSSDILFDLKREHLYVMTDQKLSKVRVQDCSVYTTCGDCLGSKGLSKFICFLSK
jgi:plexin A